MQRRRFLQIGAIGAAAMAKITGSTEGQGRPATADNLRLKPGGRSLSIVDSSNEEHRRRFQYLAECHQSIRKCMRQQMIGDYIPGHAAYNLGEYPARKRWNPDEWDQRQLEELSQAGVESIHVHEEWNDSQRLFGADKFTPVNKEGFRRFVKWAHQAGLKVIPYTSTGYFERNDPDFKPEWARDQTNLVEVYYRYARCSPASVSWRAYLLPRLRSILEDYEVDGLYNDVGYSDLYRLKEPPTRDEIIAFEESETRDGAFEDLLEIIYEEVKHYGGIVWLHAGQWYRRNRRPPSGVKLYDYFWAGEGVTDLDQVRETIKDHPPYIVPCIDLSRAHVVNEDELYLHSIPYIQFPLLLAGRPFTGERVLIPGIKYASEEKDFWVRHCLKIWRFYQDHPRGPYSYNWWDSCPGRPEARPTYYRWLKLYRPMVERGTRVFLDVTDSDLFAGPLPSGVIASVFVNRQMYLALANYSQTSTEIKTQGAYINCAKADSPSSQAWNLPARSLIILRKTEGAAR